MTDPVDILRARKAKLLAEAKRKAEALVADAKREAEALDNAAPELERAAAILAKYGLEVVEKDHLAKPSNDRVPNGHSNEDEPIITVDPALPAYRAAISVCEQAIRAANQPLELSELFDACESVGVRLGGKRPQSTLSAYLSSEKSTVESIARGTYWLKGVSRPH
jgi:hypothetical protein